MTVTDFRSLTPPKYAAALGDRQAKVLLEERLAHFISWLNEREIWLVTGMDNALRPNEIEKAIEEYVNS